jgi:hypothetical protein
MHDGNGVATVGCDLMHDLFGRYLNVGVLERGRLHFDQHFWNGLEMLDDNGND